MTWEMEEKILAEGKGREAMERHRRRGTKATSSYTRNKSFAVFVSARRKKKVTDRRTDGPTDGPTDGRTDTPSYRVVAHD